jgi:hypothetical protein
MHTLTLVIILFALIVIIVEECYGTIAIHSRN